MCRTNGRRCPSSLGRGQGGTRLSRDTYTRKAAALMTDSTAVSKVGRSLHGRALFPDERLTSERMKTADEIRETVSLAAIRHVAANPSITEQDVSPGVEDAAQVWDGCRQASGHRDDMAPFHRLPDRTQTAVVQAVRHAERQVLDATSPHEREKAARKQEHDLNRIA